MRDLRMIMAEEGEAMTVRIDSPLFLYPGHEEGEGEEEGEGVKGRGVGGERREGRA